jgi:hypothetical protein
MVLALLVSSAALAAAPGSRILATSGATQIEGSAGGGIVPWAVIAGYGSDTETGGALHHTTVAVDDFRLTGVGGNVGWNNRIELGFTRQHLDVMPLGLDIEQDIFSAKVRIAGDLIYGDAPQLSVGLQHKRNRDFTVPELLGAANDSGTDYFVSASKLWLGALSGYNLFANVTARYSDANQGGLLGFGAAGEDRELLLESSAAVFLSPNWAVGVEYRQKPDLLGLGEEDWTDAFVGWFPNKRIALVGAYASLGSIAGLVDQSGWYLSVQVTQ